MCNTCNGEKVVINENTFMAGFFPCPECNTTGRKQSLKPVIEQLNQMLAKAQALEGKTA
ncbi:hypothetical protein HW432_05790 [Bacillus pumilus]|uniref:hypothetical protein n=1 Tax=Bacillus TaxID=1386 RepID=UPI0016173E07|nr:MULTISPECIES: hypothetical protein [Bacillus]MBB6601791.1 hypothetical protein [Bacillus pumilus]MCY7631433.1 hypothetical protein [Bacillus altitudinis]WLF28837.1 hypothetical protein Q6357_10250 [Bacillus altitudinis]WMT29972.1 hypothetical protein RE735_05275 [Bacillus aerius]